METTTPYLDGGVKPQIRHYPPTKDNNNNNNLFIDFLDEYINNNSLFRRVLTLRDLPVLSVLPIPGFPLLRSSSSASEAEDKKKKLNIKVERLLRVVDYQYLRSEDDYYKAILDYDNVICICLGYKYDPLDHFVAPDDDMYDFVDLVAKKHKETRFLIADSVYCPELVRMLNPDTVLMSIQVIKERKSLGFLTFGDINQCSGEDGAQDMAFAKLLSEFEAINATEAEKNFQPYSMVDVTLGVPCIKEIINAAKKISAPVIMTKFEFPDNAKTARMVKGIENTYLGQVAKSVKIVMAARLTSIVITLDTETIQATKLSIDAHIVKESILQTPKLKEQRVKVLDGRKRRSFSAC